MNDLVKQAYRKVKHRNTTRNKFFLLKRYLAIAYGIMMCRLSLVKRLREWKKER